MSVFLSIRKKFPNNCIPAQDFPFFLDFWTNGRFVVTGGGDPPPADSRFQKVSYTFSRDNYAFWNESGGWIVWKTKQKAVEDFDRKSAVEDFSINSAGNFTISQNP